MDGMITRPTDSVTSLDGSSVSRVKEGLLDGSQDLTRDDISEV